MKQSSLLANSRNVLLRSLEESSVSARQRYAGRSVLWTRNFADRLPKSSASPKPESTPVFFTKTKATIGMVGLVWWFKEKKFSDDEDAFMEEFIQRNKRVDRTHNGQQKKDSTISPSTANKLLGVSVHHLCQDFLASSIEEVRNNPREIEKCWKRIWPFYQKNYLLPEDATVYAIKDAVIKKKGAEMTCPEDGQIGTAYVNCLEGEDHVGKANVMLSYAWGNKVEDICNALDRHCKENGLNPKRTYIWICCLCNNQHRFDEEKSFDELEQIFRDKVEGIGNVVSLFSPWDAPIYPVSGNNASSETK